MTPNYYVEALVHALFKVRYPAIADSAQGVRFYVHSEYRVTGLLHVWVGFKWESIKIGKRGFACPAEVAYKMGHEYVAMIDRAVMDLIVAGANAIFKNNKKCIVSTGETAEQSLNP